MAILIMSLIAKRFEENAKPYTAEEISEECQIPIRLTHQILYELQEINLLHEVVDENNEDIGYQPSMDINKMNVALLLDRLPEEAAIRLLGEKLKYVSRGGLKLEKALQIFPISVEGKTVADIGASTGGFSDCALQNGAVKVYAVDVGYGQLAWKLRSDERVVNMERTNVRYLEAESLGELVDAATIDVAFISLDKVLPAVHKLLKPTGFVIALVKPQFEAGKENVGKKGVVRDPKVHADVIKKVVAFAKEEGFGIAGLDFSPIKGPEGNIEYLLHLTLGDDNAVSETMIDELVSKSHGDLDKPQTQE